MKILITGATGFVGRYVIKSLVNSKVEIILVVREENKNENKKRMKTFTNVLKIIPTNDLFEENEDWWCKKIYRNRNLF